MNIDEQLKQLLKRGEGETYYSFANADGKRWWMPVRHMTVGMNLYQPSGTKGKLLKRGLPWLHWNPVVRKVLHAERIQLALGDELRELLERIFGQQELEFAIFGGTPCAHQKITMQISRNTRILGYVKVTETATGFEVVDTGPGIDSENKDRIFSPHTRATDQQQGSGMGLSIVKRLCDRFGWRVELVSHRPQGACFRVELLTGKPVARVDQSR